MPLTLEPNLLSSWAPDDISVSCLHSPGPTPSIFLINSFLEVCSDETILTGYKTNTNIDATQLSESIKFANLNRLYPFMHSKQIERDKQVCEVMIQLNCILSRTISGVDQQVGLFQKTFHFLHNVCKDAFHLRSSIVATGEEFNKEQAIYDVSFQIDFERIWKPSL